MQNTEQIQDNRKKSQSEQRIFEDQQSQQYSSFDSNGSVVENEHSDTQKIFGSFLSHKNHTKYAYHVHHKQRQVIFPQTPPNLPKLYQIYLHNETRKKQLKIAINQLIEKQLKILRVKYDQQTSAIQQFIDIQQVSKQYKASKLNYEKRHQTMKQTQKQYQKLKIKQIQTILQKTGGMGQILAKYCQDHKNIVFCDVYQDQVRVLCLEKKSGNSRGLKASSKKHPRNIDKATENQIQNRSSVTSSEDHQIHYRYTLRYFKFYECPDNEQSSQQKVAFYPMNKCIQLPQICGQTSQPIQYIGLTYYPSNQIVITYDDKKIYIIKGQKLVSQSYISQQGITFVKVLEHKIYIGTSDGVLRIYKMEFNCEINLEKMVACYYQQHCPVSHFSLTKSAQIIIFVQNEKRLCIMNLTTYTSYLLAQLPDKIIKISDKLLVTEKQVYSYYYSVTGTQLKANLKPSLTLNKYRQTITQLTEVLEKSYFLTNQGNGHFTIQKYSQLK